MVRGRSRVPLPPASRIAFIATTDGIMAMRTTITAELTETAETKRLCVFSGLCVTSRSRITMNLPNSLTITRIFLVPLLVVVLLTKFEGRQILGVPKEIVGAAIFGLASVTDWLDGYLARRRRQVTWLGQMLDPIADKLLTSAAFISLVQLGLAPAWMVALIIGREFAITALRSLAYT